MEQKIDALMNEIKNFSAEKFTGTVLLKIDFNQGGIRGAKCTEEHEVKFEN